MTKIAVVGAGNVGAVTAYCIASANLGEVVLIDVIAGMPQSRAIDFTHAATALDFYNVVCGDNDYEALRDADVVVHTAGIARKPGMDRMDLLKTNINIARKVGGAIARYAPSAMVIAVANPLDVIATVLYRETGFPASRVVGMAGILDSTRFRYFIAEKLGVSANDISALVLGGHGDTMVPLPRYTTVGGIPLPELLAAEEIAALVQRTRTGGGEIVAHLGTGSAYYAPGSSVALMVEAMVTGIRRLEPCSTLLQGEYGYHDIFLGTPVILGATGVEKIIELELNEQERAQLAESAKHVRQGVQQLDALTVD